jgi:hypothetical protein
MNFQTKNNLKSNLNHTSISPSNLANKYTTQLERLYSFYICDNLSIWGSFTLKNNSARRVSTVGSSPLVSSTQSEEFIALKQQYQQLSTNYDELRQIVMEMRSKMGDDTCVAPFWLYGPGYNRPPPPLAPPLF